MPRGSNWSGAVMEEQQEVPGTKSALGCTPNLMRFLRFHTKQPKAYQKQGKMKGELKANKMAAMRACFASGKGSGTGTGNGSD